MSTVIVSLNQREDGSLRVSDLTYGSDPPNVTQIDTAHGLAAVEDPTMPEEGPIRDLLDLLNTALGFEPEKAAIVVVRAT